MSQKLKCFISSSYEIDASLIKNILEEYKVDTIDIYDFSIGDSIQKILKRKIRQSDFALFIISDRTSVDVFFEIGVCEGIGKQYFVLLEKNYLVPSYLENKLYVKTDLQDKKFLKAAVEKILQSVTQKERLSKSYSPGQKSEVKSYNKDIKENLVSYIEQIQKIRKFGTGMELEYVIEDIFKTIRLPYIENEINKDKGVDFVLWNDELGKILGNPIIVEVKYGNISRITFNKAEEQVNKYIEKTDAKVALLLYLDKEGKRHKLKSSLYPLIISYDIEDFARDLLTHSFENLILTQRNKIAHGID